MYYNLTTQPLNILYYLGNCIQNILNKWDVYILKLYDCFNVL